MNRRRFNILALFGVVLSMCGCPWVQDVESIIPVALEALSQILAMLSNAGVILSAQASAVVGEIESGASALLSALKQYTTANAATIIPEIEAALSAFLDNFQSLLVLLGPLPDLIVNLVGAGVEIILSTIEGYIMNEPMPAATQKTLLDKVNRFRTMQLRSTTGKVRALNFTGQKRSHKKFAHDWNAVEPKQYQIKEPWF